jgi:hypothetical protein
MISPSQQGAGVRAGDGAVDSARPGARIDDQLCLDDDPPLELLVAELDELPKLDLAVAERIQFVLRRLSGDSAEAYFRQWISAAPLKHLLAWDGEPSYTMLAAPPEEVGDQYRWMVDRLTVTHFGRWRTSSLHLEWKWGNRQAEPPCRLEDMAERTIAPSELEAEIARRASVSDLSSASPTCTLDQLAGQALNLIEDGKREVAASLFEAVCAAEPESAEAQNNCGFCLLPDDPSGALDHLTLADALAYENRAMNAVDRMQAYLLLGQPRAALRTAERILSDWDQLSPRLTAYLWSFPPTGPRLIQVRDARPIAMALAGAAAAMLGDDTEPWDKRHEHSCGELLIDCECKLTVPPSDIRRLAN